MSLKTTDSADIDRYFARIGFRGPARADLPTLRALHLAHAQAIPFENLTPLTGEPVALDPSSLVAKLVDAERGGYCFEHNLLFCDVLTALGFEVTRLSARVVWRMPDDAPANARTHALLKVDLPEGPYLADVGFGGLTQTAPLRFVPGLVQETPHEPFRIVEIEPGLYQSEALVAGEWIRLYRFDLSPQLRIDYEVASHYVGTHPTSFFTFNLLGARPFPGGRFAIFDNQMAIHHLNGPSEKVELATYEDLRGALAEKFLIRLPDSANLEFALRRLLTRA